METEFVRIDADDPVALADALDVMRASERRLRGRARSSVESLRAWLTSAETVADEAWLSVRRGVPAGLLVLERSSGSDEVFVEFHVGGGGGDSTAKELLERGVTRASSLPGVRRLQASSRGDDDDTRQALAESGFVEVRRYWRMRQDLAGTSDARPSPPDGVTLRVVVDEADLRTLHGLREATFRDSDGFEPRAYEDYVAVLDAVVGADPDGRWVAELDGRPVALCVSDDSRASQGEGYLRTVGVLPEARGRGIARWLLACAAAYAVGRGRTALVLTVDGRNTTGATALYRSAGYEVTEVIDVWERPVGNARANADSR